MKDWKKKDLKQRDECDLKYLKEKNSIITLIT